MAAAMVLGCALLAGGCGGSEEVTDYQDENRDAFLSACVNPVEDNLIDVELCQCVYDELESELTFEEFAVLEQTLVDHPERPLPSAVVDVVAACVIRAAEL